METDRRLAFRRAIQAFIDERLNEKLKKLNNDPENEDERQALRAKYEWSAWLDDAARRSRLITIATHTVKGIHTSIPSRITNLHCPPATLKARSEMGSQALGDRCLDDVVGDSKALDIYKLLSIKIDECTILGALLTDDKDLKAALSNDEQQAMAWMTALKAPALPRESVASHTLAKQIYWLLAEDPVSDSYHILGPLFPSSLMHAISTHIAEVRFNKEAQAARQARWKGIYHPTGFAEYPNLALLKLGGTNPQNAGQLNSQRSGNNYLLSCAPPHWRSLEHKPLWNAVAAFPAFQRQNSELYHHVKNFRGFLEKDPRPVMETRVERKRLFDEIVDSVIQEVARLQQNTPPGWTADDRCHLPIAERLWLDPYRSRTDPEFRSHWLEASWLDTIANRFARWLNDELDERLPMGDPEHREWKRGFDDELDDMHAELRSEVEALETVQGSAA